ncbi:yecA family protein [Roseobacter sp. AzwK-3b]|uniref:YecA/YgfB family protein n=1 Tax=Roseobacter sp. AzwK-3b TaxID=351016 RepID=UPI0001568F7E|nr:YecA family protein [Roseobacter sp. AzwK-3b]EDM72233.1 yecA family protein [Roseobacter sp. AzwK-3b]
MQQSSYGTRHLVRLGQLLSEIPAQDRDQPPMTVSELNGFLIGVALSPDPVDPQLWLPCIWGGGSSIPLSDAVVAQLLIDAVVEHYNEILRQLHETSACDLVLKDHPNQLDTRWEPWVAGFELAMILASDGWQRMMKSDDEDASSALSLIMALYAIDMGESTLSKQQVQIFEKTAPELLPHCVTVFQKWRRRRNPFTCQTQLKKQDVNQFILSENMRAFPEDAAFPCTPPDACRCGSGRQYIKCCGAH